MTKYHSLVGTGSRHALHDLEYPTQADLAAGTNEINGLSANAQRILRLARVQEDSTFYFLMDDDPLTWLKLLTQDDIDTVTLDVAYNNHGGAAGIAVDAGSVTWTLDSTYDFIIDLTSAATGSRGFLIEETTGNDYIRAETESETGDYINWTAEVRQINFNSNQYIYLNSEQKIALNATDTDSPVLIGTTSTSGDQGNLVIQATSADGSTYGTVWKDSGAASIATLNSDGDFVTTGTISATTAGIGIATPTDVLSIQDNSSTGVATLGSELLTNGGFDSDLSSWTAGANWSWSAGTALHTAGDTATIYQGIATTANEYYYIEVVITGRTAGSVVMTLQNSTATYILSSNTTYKYAFIGGSTGTNNLIFTPTSDFNGALDSVSAKQVISATTYALSLYDSGGTFSGFGIKSFDSTLRGISEGQDSAINIISSQYFVAQGYNAAKFSVTGSYWVAQGYRAAESNTSGDYWIAQGYRAGFSNLYGSSWIAQGPNAGFSNVSGYSWIAQGSSAGYANTSGNYWIAQGYLAGASNVSGSNWIAQGYQAGYANTASNWVAQGYRAAYSNTSGANFVAQGYQAARYIDGGGANTTCTDFVCLGYDTRLSADGSTNEIVIGTSAIGVGSNSVVLGNLSITTTILRGNTAIGTTELDGTPAIGRLVVKGSTNDGSTNVLVLRDSDEANVLWIDTNGGIHTDQWLDQDSNTFLGVNVAGAGVLAHSSGSEGYYNTGTGRGSLYSNSTGHSNSALGYNSLYYNTTGNYNSTLGRQSAYYVTGGSNTILGAYSCYGVSGSSAVANNVCIGYYAGYSLQTGGDNNTLLGYSAGDNITTGASNIIIGVGIDAPSATDDNQLNIGDTIYGDLSTGNAGIGAMPLTNMAAGDLLLEGGSLVLKEITTPTADANYGKVYTKSDNKLYFQDGGGTEHEISFV